MHRAPVIVVGAGVGGLAAAVALAAQGEAVTVVERDSAAGGKLRPVQLGGQWLDAGPTVLTMRGVFDRLFALAGQTLDDHLALSPLQVLARHAWPDGSRLDLFADSQRAAEAMGALAGAQAARQYLAFCARTRRVFQALDRPYLQSARPNPLSLAWRCGVAGLPGLLAGQPMRSLWQSLGRQFDDPRLRQLFARYATYGGSSPWQAPATLMLIAHVEQTGVWSVAGGMQALATALVALARRLGVQLHFGQGVRALQLAGGRVSGVVLDEGQPLPARAVVFNGDVAALAGGALGAAAQRAVAARPVAARSLSALTWTLVAPAHGFALLRHNVFFSADYAAEFRQLFGQQRLPEQPTVYVCAQDRGDQPLPDDGQPERLLCLVNAPARDDTHPLSDEEIAACQSRSFDHLARLGLHLPAQAPLQHCHPPAYWAQRFPATGGALYGQATHGWRSSFSRPTARSRLPGLYLAGGSTHPGAGVPMAALSGLQAAQAWLADRPRTTSTLPCPTAAMPGGTWTR